MTELPVLQSNRSCGGCTACCTICGVQSIDKWMYERCKHQCDAGCSIYETRPEECKAFVCQWLTGFIEGDEWRRPDNLGLMFTITTIQEDGKDRLTAWEVRDGAINEQSYFLDKLSRKYAVIVVSLTGVAWVWRTTKMVRMPILRRPDGRSAGTLTMNEQALADLQSPGPGA